MPRVLVVGRETRGMRTLADLAIDDFFQRVDALGRVGRVGDVHEMHGDGYKMCCVACCRRLWAVSRSGMLELEIVRYARGLPPRMIFCGPPSKRQDICTTATCCMPPVCTVCTTAAVRVNTTSSTSTPLPPASTSKHSPTPWLAYTSCSQSLRPGSSARARSSASSTKCLAAAAAAEAAISSNSHKTCGAIAHGISNSMKPPSAHITFALAHYLVSTSHIIVRARGRLWRIRRSWERELPFVHPRADGLRANLRRRSS